MSEVKLPLRASAEGEDLSELFDAFDVKVSYHKPGKRLELSAAVSRHFLEESESETADTTEDGSQVSIIAGAEFEPATFGL